MSKTKPLLPTPNELVIADSLRSAIAIIGEQGVAELPTKIRPTIEHFAEVGELAEDIRNQQPASLAGYVDDLIQTVGLCASRLEEDEVAAVVAGLISSQTLTRILADVAAGNIDPVARVAKARKPSVEKASVVEPEATEEPGEEEPGEEDTPAAVASVPAPIASQVDDF